MTAGIFNTVSSSEGNVWRHSQSRSFSIVICTDGRASALQRTLHSLSYLNGPPFEIVVVRGPTEDGITDVLAAWEGRLKIVKNATRNLSVSRNLGIAAAAGEVIAFLDDDAIPEPEWLEQLAAAYMEPVVGGAGGFVFNPDGVTYQYQFGTVDRLGRADLSWNRPAPELSFPFSNSFPHPLGANSSFLRAALMEISGFDEEFEYYLDETDVTLRLVDAGWRMAQVEGACVHHKFMPSAIRNEARILMSWYAVLKNHIYFGLVNGLLHHSINTVISEAQVFIQKFARDVDFAVGAGKLTDQDRMRFRQEVDRAWRDGLVRGLSGQRRIPSKEWWATEPMPFLPFQTLQPPTGRRCFCFLSQEYPPGPIGGIGRYTHSLAVGVAALGHQVHVITRGESHDRVDFEDGVWVHRVLPRPNVAQPPEAPVPPHIWEYASTMLDEVRSIAIRRPVTAVYAPIWDCEGAAVLFDGGIPLVTGLQTTLHFWLDSHPHIAADATFLRDFAEPMLALERRLLCESNAIHAISAAIARDISAAYEVRLEEPRVTVLPLGLEDWSRLAQIEPDPLPKGAIRVLFVGRLESRKGIDVLLEVSPHLLARHPKLHFDFVGNDKILGPDGVPYRTSFEARTPVELLDRVHFHGEVSETVLRGLYRACDLLVAPSRFESFGLILVEAMMYGKAVVACRVGGMVEVVEEGQTALLAEPGDAASLEVCLERLIADSALRRALGEAGRQRYEARFTARYMAEGVAAFLTQVADEQKGAPVRMSTW